MEVNVSNLVHFFDLHFDLVQVLKNVDQLLTLRVIPLLSSVLQLYYLLLHQLVLLQMLTQLVSISTLTHPL